MALRLFWTMGAALALAGCGGGISNDDVLNKIDREMERRGLDNDSEAAPAADAGGPIERARLVGRWSDAPGCQDVISEFQGDGTFRVGDRTGTWSLEGNRLTIGRGGGQTSTLTVESISETEFLMTAEGGQRLRSYRCAAPVP